MTFVPKKMSEITRKALQRIFDDDPPLAVWREERGLSLMNWLSRESLRPQNGEDTYWLYTDHV